MFFNDVFHVVKRGAQRLSLRGENVGFHSRVVINRQGIKGAVTVARAEKVKIVIVGGIIKTADFIAHIPGLFQRFADENPIEL